MEVSNCTCVQGDDASSASGAAASAVELIPVLTISYYTIQYNTTIKTLYVLLGYCLFVGFSLCQFHEKHKTQSTIVTTSNYVCTLSRSLVGGAVKDFVGGQH